MIDALSQIVTMVVVVAMELVRVIEIMVDIRDNLLMDPIMHVKYNIISLKIVIHVVITVTQ